MAHYSFSLAEIGGGLSAPLIIVMPIYNEEANIENVISSWFVVLRELEIDFEIVALDDGSRDRTHETLLKLEAEQPSRLCVVTKPNGGHGSTCRIGYDIAIHSKQNGFCKSTPTANATRNIFVNSGRNVKTPIASSVFGPAVRTGQRASRPPPSAVSLHR